MILSLTSAPALARYKKFLDAAILRRDGGNYIDGRDDL